MPPKPKRRKRTNQCVIYDERTRRRCSRAGKGDPAMCDPCREAISMPSPLGQLFESILGGRPPSANVVKDATIQAVEGLLGRKLTADELAGVSSAGGFSWQGAFAGVRSRVSSQHASQDSDANQRRAQDQAELEKARAISRARRALGFSAKEPITPELLKARHRELTKKWHPDRFASDPEKYKAATSKMAEINAAVDILSNPL